ncbi:MAG: 50S ribosomal protein L18 [Deltaproteobacteria bacterium]|nr:50S ribosomal protein L18 [Deltaproteobacteria bacterium]
MRTKIEGRMRRKRRIRKKIFGTAERPRLCVFKSDKHFLGQLVNDLSGNTLLFVSSRDKQFKGQKDMAKVSGAVKVGALLAERALSGGIKTVVFDRGGFAFHGRVKAFADAAREKGLVF